MAVSKRYKVKNVTDQDIYLDWNESLLPDAESEAWNDYKKTEAYYGNPEQRAAREKIPNQTKLQEWISRKGLGDYKMWENPNTGDVEREPRRNPITKIEEYIPMFKIAKGATIEVGEREIPNFERLKVQKVTQKLELGKTTPEVLTEGLFEITDLGRVAPSSSTPTQSPSNELTSKNRNELMKIAKERGIKTDLSMSKDKILELLK